MRRYYQKFNNGGHPYTGIIGIECVLTGEDNFVVEDVKPFLQNHDSRAVLNLCEDDLIKIFTSCINGFFSDEYENIKTNDYSSVSITAYFDKDNEEMNFDDLSDTDFVNVKKQNEKYYSEIGANFTLTKTASTISRAKKYLTEEIEALNLSGMNFRKDICAKIEQ